MSKSAPTVAVITADIIGSTQYDGRDRALVTRELRRAFSIVSRQYSRFVTSPATFRITAGDEFQWTVGVPQKAFEIVVFLRSIAAQIDLHPMVTFRASIGVGAVTVDGGRSSYEKDGPAFVQSRAGLQHLAGSRGRWTALRTSDPSTDRTADVLLTFLDSIQQRWTRAQWQAVRWALTGLNRSEIATKLRVAHQSVSKRLIAADWDAFSKGVEFIAELSVPASIARGGDRRAP